MELIYAETINSIADNMDNMWKDKDAFSSVKSSGNISIQDANMCSYNRFMLSTKSDNKIITKTSNISTPKQTTNQKSLSLSDRLAKSASIWTLPDISREKADKILAEFQPGIFIVRMSNDKKTMVLSYRMELKCQHVLIKVDLKKGFFMDGSQHVFRNVNHMIAHYMKHPIQNPDLSLKLPRALMEAYDPIHFQFFENLKISFWTTMLAKKSIEEIWSKPINNPETKDAPKDCEDSESVPVLPPRNYLVKELNVIQGLADIQEDPIDYQIIEKKTGPKNQSQSKPLSTLECSAPKSEPTIQSQSQPLNTLECSDPKSEPTIQSQSQPLNTLECLDPKSEPTIQSQSQPLITIELPSSDPKSGPIIQSPFLAPIAVESPSSDSESCINIRYLNDEERTRSENERPQTIMSNDIYGEVWIKKSEDNPMSAPEPSIKVDTKNLDVKVQNDSRKLTSSFLSESVDTKLQENQNKSTNEDTYVRFTIPKIIEKYYPQLVYNGDQLLDSLCSYPSLQQKILQRHRESLVNSERAGSYARNGDPGYKDEATTYNDQYATPWDVKNSWISDLIDLNCTSINLKDCSSFDNIVCKEAMQDLDISHSICTETMTSINGRERVIDDQELKDGSDDDEELYENENRLQLEFLGAIESVMFASSAHRQNYWTNRTTYGQSIRTFLTKLCSGYSHSEISKSIRLFIRCTIDRTDLSPYTTMRLIRQYMSGLKNLITKNKESFGIDRVINEEIKKTPQNVFINLDSIIESVLTRSVVKPLRIHLYRLLVLEHYKNNNLKQISEGVEICKCISAEKLGLKENAKSLIDSKMDAIRRKFNDISRQYSPEKKIKSMIAIVDIVFNMVESIYPTMDSETIKSNNIIPLFVYVFSQCKLDAIATQCEVEYVEGLIWSSKLVNGEPGFFLLNLMSALEAIKVLAIPKLNPDDFVDISDQKSSKHCSLSQSAIGSVNVIIMDEKINRMITKSIPVRSTVTVSSLCNTISHRLGIFNPKDYNLFSFSGREEKLLLDHESPLMIKILHQQKFKENINFLYKRKNANFILPVEVSKI